MVVGHPGRGGNILVREGEEEGKRNVQEGRVN